MLMTFLHQICNFRQLSIKIFGKCQKLMVCFREDFQLF